MIEKDTNPKGSPAVKITCDTCGKETLRVSVRGRKIPRHVRTSDLASDSLQGLDLSTVGRAANAAGWRVQKGKHTCPHCIERARQVAQSKRKTPMNSTKKLVVADTVMTIPEMPDAPRAPSREMKRSIRLLLNDVYDVEKGRYRDAETDKSVAEAIGGGCMIGWVTIEREEGYGESGENEQTDGVSSNLEALEQAVNNAVQQAAALRSEIMAEMEKMIGTADRQIADMNAVRAEIRAARSKMDSIKKAIGPKGERI